MPLWEWLNGPKQAQQSSAQGHKDELPERGRNSTTSRQRTGDEGEQRALLYLQQKGMTLIERNFLCKGGEIDLVMQDDKGLVFVEVRSRNSSQFGGALASVTPAKQRRMVIAAQVFLQAYKRPPACRFDLICIQNGELDWLQDVITGQ